VGTGPFLAGSTAAKQCPLRDLRRPVAGLTPLSLPTEAGRDTHPHAPIGVTASPAGGDSPCGGNGIIAVAVRVVLYGTHPRSEPAPAAGLVVSSPCEGVSAYLQPFLATTRQYPTALAHTSPRRALITLMVTASLSMSCGMDNHPGICSFIQCRISSQASAGVAPPSPALYPSRLSSLAVTIQSANSFVRFILVRRPVLIALATVNHSPLCARVIPPVELQLVG
jgi:hypothetical protein